jgi:hypothetical protein
VQRQQVRRNVLQHAPLEVAHLRKALRQHAQKQWQCLCILVVRSLAQEGMTGGTMEDSAAINALCVQNSLWQHALLT